MTLSPSLGVDWLSGSPAAPGSGVNITRHRGVSLDASIKSSPSGTSMSISSNSKLKAAFTWAVHTTPAVALFSRPTRLSSSRSARVNLIRRWQPAMAHLTGTFLGISPILQRQLEEGGGHASRVFSVGLYLGCGVGKSLHPSSPGQRLAPRKGPLNAENAVRTTGLLTAGHNQGARTGPACRTVARPAPLPHQGREVFGDVYRCSRQPGHADIAGPGHELTLLPRVGLSGRIRPAGRDGAGDGRGETAPTLRSDRRGEGLRCRLPAETAPATAGESCPAKRAGPWSEPPASRLGNVR